MSEHDLAALRREYTVGGLSEADLAPDPFAMFRRWLDAATDAGLHEPNAMVVSTASASGAVSSRTVLLKGLDEGFVFYTNYDSRKGEELAANASCALLFPWHVLERQVRVEGRASLVSRAETAAYFGSRPRGSRLGAWASPQSRVVPDRAELERAFGEVERRFAGNEEVPTPEHWGGYRVVPEVVEFWQGRADRMHDRLRYRRTPAGWAIERLAP